MTTRDLGAGDAALLTDLIDRYPFKSYRNHRWLSRERQSAVMRAEIDRILQAGDSVAVLQGDGAALAVARRLPWDSTFFGVPMGRVEYVLRSDDDNRDALQVALSAALDRLRRMDVRHVSLKADVADQGLIGVAEDAGFRLMDAIVTYISHPRRQPPRPVKAVGNLRPFRPEDTAAVLDVTREAYADYKGRFQLDPHLPAEKSREFYLEWARNCCSGAMADRIFVAEDAEGQLIGWASVKTAELVSVVGQAPISVGSLGACRADAMGAYAGLICAAAVENHAKGVLTEAMTQNSNFAMVRVLESVGALYARAEYTFHVWLE